MSTANEALEALPVQHATIKVTRLYDHSPETIFAAFADPEARKRWQPTPDGMQMVYEAIDFRLGGCERSRMLQGGQQLARFEQHYVDMVPASRIVVSV